MSIEVRKKNDETTGALLRRFTRLIQQSKVLKKAKAGRFYQKSKTKRQVRETALRRRKLLRQREQLIKAGLLEEGQMIPKDKLRQIDI